MDYIKPKNIEPIEYNIINENYPIWNSTTTYQIDDRVILNDKLYIATVTSNGKNPEQFNTLKSIEPVWSSPYTINYKRCFEVTTTNRTVGTDRIYYKFPYKGYTTIAFLQTLAYSLEIRILDEDGNLIHTITDGFTEDYRTNYTKWRNGDYYLKDSLIIDIPYYPNGFYLEVDIKGGEEISIPFMVFGNRLTLGDTQTDIKRESSCRNPTYIDEWGDIRVQEETFTTQYVDVDCFIEPSMRREIIRNMQKIVGKMALFIVTDEEGLDDLNFLAYVENITDTTKIAGFGDLSLELKGFLNVDFH